MIAMTARPAPPERDAGRQLQAAAGHEERHRRGSQVITRGQGRAQSGPLRVAFGKRLLPGGPYVKVVEVLYARRRSTGDR